MLLVLRVVVLVWPFLPVRYSPPVPGRAVYASPLYTRRTCMATMKVGHLAESFCATTYVVLAPDGPVRFRIAAPAPDLDLLLDRRGAACWAFVTAWNPGSIQQAHDENVRRNRDLLHTLTEAGYQILNGYGAGDDGCWEPEESFFILDIPVDAALGLGQRYRQAAVVVGERGGPPELLWC